jgi:hypothetical protein
MKFNITAHFDGDTPSQDAVIIAADQDAARAQARATWPDAVVWTTQAAQ